MTFNLIYVLLLFTALFLGLEARNLVKRQDFKELFIATLLLVLGWAYGVDYALHYKVLPDPQSLLTVTRPISDSFEQFFQVKS